MSFEDRCRTSRRKLTLQALEHTNTIRGSLLLFLATPPRVHLTEPLAAVLAHLGTVALPGAFLPEALSLPFLEDFLCGTRAQIGHVLMFDERAPYACECTDRMEETESGKVGVIWWVVEGGHEGRSMQETRGMGVGDEKGLDEVTEEVGGGKTGWPIAIHEASWTYITKRILG